MSTLIGTHVVRCIITNPFSKACSRSCGDHEILSSSELERKGAAMIGEFLVGDAIVEIPRGSRNKYEFDPDSESIRLDRVLYSSVH